MNSCDPSPLGDDRPAPVSSVTCDEFRGEAVALRPRLRAAGPIAVLDYWDKLRGARRFPARADFDPMAVRKYLPNIIMFDVLPQGALRYRVVGTGVAEFFGVGKPAGMTPEEIFGSNAERVLAPLRFVCSTGQTCMRRASARWIHRGLNYFYYEVVTLPLGESDAAVDKLLCCAELIGAPEAACA